MKRRVDVIEALARANPVPPGRVYDESDPSLEELLRSESERMTGMSTTTAERPAPARKRPTWPKYIGAVAGLIVAIGLILPFTRPDSPVVDWRDVPAAQQAVVEQVIQAVNDRDATGLSAVFTPEGTFLTHIQFEPRAACCDSYPVQESQLVQTWLSVAEVWGLDAELQACATESTQSVRCQVVTRWHSLQMETPEEWLFTFDGSHLASWGMLLQPGDVPDPELPLSYDDLNLWQQWLEENQPDQAERFSANGATFGEYSIDGVPYEPNAMLRFDPAHAEEIRTSIEEYVAHR